jgi:hypothetical protein
MCKTLRLPPWPATACYLTLVYLLSDLPKDAAGAIIIDHKTLQLLRSGAQMVDQYGAPLKI